MVVVWGLHSGIAAAAARGKAAMRLGVGVGKVGGRGRILAFLRGGVHGSKAIARDSITIMVVMLPKMVGSLLPVKVLLSLVKAILSYAIVLLLHHSEQSYAHLSLKSVPKDTPLPSLPWGSTTLRFPSEIQFSRPQHEIYCLHYQSLTKKLGVDIWN